MRFEWDPAKARSNRRKHKVSFDEAVTVFRDPLARIVDDPDHSTDQRREIAIGHSIANRLRFVFFTEREQGIVRIILLVRQHARSEKIMKKSRNSEDHSAKDKIRREYRIDYSKSRPNRFLKMATEQPLVVMVDEDIARVFPTPESVNHALRALITAMPKTTPKRLNK
jgi:uncharacterized protein